MPSCLGTAQSNYHLMSRFRVYRPVTNVKTKLFPSIFYGHVPDYLVFYSGEKYKRRFFVQGSVHTHSK